MVYYGFIYALQEISHVCIPATDEISENLAKDIIDGCYLFDTIFLYSSDQIRVEIKLNACICWCNNKLSLKKLVVV